MSRSAQDYIVEQVEAKMRRILHTFKESKAAIEGDPPPTDDTPTRQALQGMLMYMSIDRELRELVRLMNSWHDELGALVKSIPSKDDKDDG